MLKSLFFIVFIHRETHLEGKDASSPCLGRKHATSLWQDERREEERGAFGILSAELITHGWNWTRLRLRARAF